MRFTFEFQWRKIPALAGGHPAFASGFDLVVCCGVLCLGDMEGNGYENEGC